ncbi:hypothetical protein [Georgenia yuyongxinii]|uniref:hypothetical protein n=1 Tax=Georgenia yuyongxinii TaxID=2589797 RepID=UPI001E37AC60|nr:hypothetical protein [Georgenia yuyongxinii]
MQPAPSATASGEPSHASELPRPPDGVDGNGLLPPGTPSAISDLPSLALPTTAPANAAAVGALVEGFPTEVIPVAPATEVISSDVSSEGRRTLISLHGRQPASVEDVVGTYRDSFAAIGFVERPSPSVEGSRAVSFTRDTHALVLTVRPEGDGAVFTLSGVLQRGG